MAYQVLELKQEEQPEEARRHKSIHLPSASIIRSAHRKLECSGAEDGALSGSERTTKVVISGAG